MMDAVFAFFIEHNPGACEKLKSVIIDKDYKEWRTLEASFPMSVVVLCTFHVLKYFKFVVTQAKYGFSDDTKAAVRGVLRRMVFAPDVDAFAAQQVILARLLDPDVPGHVDFLQYMETYWYSCVDKWSYSGRGYIFTAANTTSNRLEAYWNQYKRTLGGKLRVDNCFEAIFIHSGSVLRRELGIFADYEAAKPVHTFADPYLQPVLIELSKYAAKLVQRQWTRYAMTSDKMEEVVVEWVGATRVVRVKTAREVDFKVNTDKWTCSCHFHQGSALPCRHLFFVARDLLAMSRYPVVSLAQRWCMGDTTSLIPTLEKAIKELDTLRLGLPSAAGADSSDAPSFKFPSVRSVAHVKLPFGAVSTARVRDDMNKRCLVDSVLDPLKQLMMAQGTANFNASLENLGTVVRAFIAQCAAPPVPSVPNALPVAIAATDEVSSSTAVGPSTPVGSPTPDSPVRGDTERYPFDDSETESEDWRAFDAAYTDEDDEEYFEEEEAPIPSEVGDAYTLVDTAPDVARFDNLDLNVYGDSDATSIFGSQTSFGFLTQSQPLLGAEVVGPRFPVQPAAPVQFGRIQTLLSAAGGSFGLPIQPSRLSGVLRAAVGIHSNAIAHSDNQQSDPLDVLMADLDGDEEDGADADGDDSIAPSGGACDDDEKDDEVGITADSGPSAADAKGKNEVVTSSRSGDSVAIYGARPRSHKRVREIMAADPESPARNTRARVAVKREPVVIDHPVISSLKIPSVIRRSSAGVSKQLSSSTGRTAAVLQKHDCPVDLSDFLLALRYVPLPEATRLHALFPRLFSDTYLQTKGATARLESFLPAAEYRVNFVVPTEIVSKMMTQRQADEKAVVKAREHQVGGPSDGGRVHVRPVSGPPVDGLLRPQYVVRIAQLRHFTVDSVHDMVEFYAIGSKLEQYVEDEAWPSAAWVPPLKPEPIALLEAEADKVEGHFHTMGTERMRADVRGAFASLSLASCVSVPGDHGSRYAGRPRVDIAVEEVLGRLAYTKELNDSVLNFSLHLLASRYPGVVVVDSLYVGKPVTPPRVRLADTTVIVFPMHYGGRHWGVVVALITDGLPSTAVIYDPMHGNGCLKYLESKWLGWCWSLLEKWHARDHTASHRLIDVTGDIVATAPALKPAAVVVVSTPKQSDSSSCGLYCILQAHAYMAGDYSIQEVEKFTTAYPVKLARLRLLWLILCRSDVRIDEDCATRARTTVAAFDSYAEGQAARTPAKKKQAKKQPLTATTAPSSKGVKRRKSLTQ